MGAEISVNRKALRDFHILARYEAGIELKGTEVKSIRTGRINPDSSVVFMHTGGTPALFAYADILAERIPPRRIDE